MKKQNRVAHTNPSEFSLEQVYKFCAEFGRQGGNPDLLQELTENKRRMVSAISIARGDNVPKEYELATLILGDDFLPLDEVANVYGFNYSEEQSENFAETLPDEKKLQQFRTHGYMLVAGPTTELNPIDVRGLDDQLFDSETDCLYVEDKEKFAKTDVVKAGEWLSILKEEVPNSLSKTWDKQQNLLTEVERVPNASEVSYAVTAYYKVRDIYLLSEKYVRTSSVSADGNHVCVGLFDKDGLKIHSCWDSSRHDLFGISSVWK